MGRVEQRGALGGGAVANPKKDGRGAGQAVLEDRQRRDPDAAADEDRPPSLARRDEAAAQRPERPQPIARAQLTQAPRPGADVLEQEMRLAVAATGDREGAR